MNYKNLIQIALRALANNKMRGFLTMLGIIIGVSSVIVMMTLGASQKESIRSDIGSMGTNMIIIHPYSENRGGVRQSAADMQTLKMYDYQSLVRDCKYTARLSPVFTSSAQAIYGNNNTPTVAYGVEAGYLDIRNYTVGRGSMFTDNDIKRASKVCVVGQTVVDKLFTKGEDPLGMVIRFGSIPFRIIGVLSPKGYDSGGNDQDNLIITPYTTVQKRILAINYIPTIFASALSEEYTDQAVAEISEILQINHRIAIGETNDFEVFSMQEMLNTLNSVMNTLTAVLSCVAGISLLVGGIGIMNIMYVSVTERTREIGLRMSIGAKGRHIMLQFLIESIIISVTGGIIGVVFGFILSWLGLWAMGWPFSIQLFPIVLSFAVCTVTGVFFGWYPARKAARLNPIDAIRFE
ncbi:MAG: ABC transporter permease [Rikenellaceae bacterium]|nr:ABC transporter permease [Rikenellaceae bacterium]